MKTGDIVQLKSEGCDMTVLDVHTRYDYHTGEEYQEVSVVWHDSSYDPCQADYDSRVLRKVEK